MPFFVTKTGLDAFDVAAWKVVEEVINECA